MFSDQRLPAAAKKHAFRLGLVAAAMSLLAGAARAENLQELYDMAHAYDATYLAARAQAESAQYKADQAKALFRPSVAATLSTGRRMSELAPSLLNNDLVRVYGNSSGATIDLRQSLFNRANSKAVDQAERGLEVSKSQLAAAEQELIIRVAQAYFDVLAAQDVLTTVKANKAAISEQLASAKRNFEVGTATITDTREAQARYDLAVAQEIAANNDLLVKRVTIDQLVGKSGVAPKSLAVPVKLPAFESDRIDQWVQKAEAEHPSIVQARLGYEIAKLETEKSKAGHLPTLGLTASAGQTRGWGGAQEINPKSASIGVALSIPIYEGNLTSNRVKETVALEEKSRLDLEAARRAVTQLTRQAYLGVVSGRSSVQAFEAAETSNKLLLESTQLGYKVGVRVNLDVLNAQNQLYSTQKDLAKARYDVIVGGLKLLQASGQLVPTDLVSVNNLVAK